MKPKKSPPKKLTKKSTRTPSKHLPEIRGILLLAFAILTLAAFLFENSVGIVGSIIRSFLLGMMGPTAFILPILLGVCSFYILFRRNTDITQKAWSSSILLLLVSSLIQTIFQGDGYKDLSGIENLAKSFTDGEALLGGGLIGGIISLPLVSLFQTIGTTIIIITIMLITLMVLTDTSFTKVCSFLYSFVSSAVSRFFASPPSVQPVQPKFKSSSSPSLQGLEPPKPEQPPSYMHSGQAEEPTISIAVAPQKIEKVEPLDLPKLLTSEENSAPYEFPPAQFLNDNPEGNKDIKALKNAALEDAKKLEDTLKSFGVEAKVINISRGPAVTRYELQPSQGVKVSRIVSLSDDISLNLAALGIRIEAPIPGKAAIGIEVPNKEVTPVFLKEVIASPEFKTYPSKLAFALGKNIAGDNIIADIAKMPHILVAGATGSGKSVCINSLIISLLYKSSPQEVKLLMVDPKVVELGIYNGIPHLLIPVVTDPKKAAGALNWAVQEMISRYKLFAAKGVRDIRGYNTLLEETDQPGVLPQIVIIIDELADLMMVAPNDVEDSICRLAQMARAAGMHLVIATQRPSVDVITGVIKANIPSRISFAVSSQVDSRTILDMAGAEKLLGRGDMLFYPVGESKPVRVKGAFVSDKEVEKVVEFVKAQSTVEYDDSIIENINGASGQSDTNMNDDDDLLPQAVDLVVETGQASVSLIQRRFKVGYARAARIIDQMELKGIVGPFEGSKPRQVIMSRQQWLEMQISKENAAG